MSSNEVVLFPFIRLLSCLTEHLTAEIVQLSVSDITRAIEWMKCSFLYVRMKKACILTLIQKDIFHIFF